METSHHAHTLVTGQTSVSRAGMTATVTATAATNGKRQRLATAHNARRRINVNHSLTVFLVAPIGRIQQEVQQPMRATAVLSRRLHAR